MSNQLQPEDIVAEGFNWRAVAWTLLKGWKIIAVCVAAGMVTAVIRLHLTYPIYAAQMVVTPIQSQNEASPASSKLSALSGLASLAGVNTSSSLSATQFRLYVDSIHSRDLAVDLAKNKDLLKYLYGDEWDEATQTWHKPPRGLLTIASDGIFTFLGAPPVPWEAPGGARLQQFLNSDIQIIQDPKKPYLVTIEYDSGDPHFAVDFLNRLNNAANDHLRQKALLRARQYIDYLSNKLNTVTIAEHREAIMVSLSEQEKFAMTASSAAPFAADIFDQPSYSSTPIQPQPNVVYLKAFLLAGMFGAGIVLALKYFGDFLRNKILVRLPVQKLPHFLQRQLQS